MITAIVLCGLLVARTTPARADMADDPSLTISQLKITSSNGQFITLYNATDTALDMSKYQLEYFNSYDLSKATSSKLIALSGTVPPHGYFMVNDSSLLLCYQLTVDSVSLGLSSTAGLVEVLAFSQANPGSPVTPALQDYVGWSKTAAAGAQTLPTSTSGLLQRLPVDSGHNPLVNAPGAGSWQSVQPDSSNACNLVGSGSGGGTIIQTGLSQLLPSAEPPATILELTDGAASVSAASPATLPSSDIGLMAPAVTEILPNPAGTGNDTTDEFIELYNSNSTSFDLSGFSLQSGLTSLHTYIFPAGTTLPAQSFTAFYSKTTGLSLSNSGGQVKLLDPPGNSISATGVYDTANDGQTWALAKGKWYWTTTATPGKANIINQPAAKKKASDKSAASKSKPAKTTAGKTKGAATASGDTDADVTTSPIHLWTLALVAGLALLYGAYEYRTDMANRIYQLRRHFGNRDADRT